MVQIDESYYQYISKRKKRVINIGDYLNVRFSQQTDTDIHIIHL